MGSVPAPRKLKSILALDDFEVPARRLLPRMVYSYIAGAVETGAGYRKAARAFDEYSFIPRVLRDVSGREQTKKIFGKTYASPVGIAPLGGAAISAYRGDLVLADAASRMRQPMIMSASSLIKLEDVHRVYPGAWFQAYLAGDERRIDPMIDRVGAAGFDTLVITVDTPVPGNRENNVRNGYSMPIRMTPRVALDCFLHPRWTLLTLGQTFLRHGMPHFENMDATRGPPMMSRNLVRNLGDRDQFDWRHLEIIRKRWPGKLVVKGVLALDDARRCREVGVDGIILSNHGGRQLDHSISPLRVLPEIRAEMGELTLMIDGSMRRGADVIKALALGADFAFIGRPFMFAAALAGSRGVMHAMELLRAEIDRNMAMLGVERLDELNPGFLRYVGPAGSSACEQADDGWAR
ncbi:MAG: alpha-hydroxy acid oxidase [Pseudaminobacter sp.]